LASEGGHVAGVPLLEARGVTKSFGGNVALAGVDLTLNSGEVHALVGENGAGKSTLIKIVTGALRRDGGTVRLDGEPVDFRSPQEAQARGVVAVYQEVNLLEGRSVAENVLLGREPTRRGLIDWRTMYRRAGEVMAGIGLDVEPRATLGTLPVALRQLIGIARGVSLGARLLVLDEPTSSLSDREVELLYGVVRRLRANGVGVVYISHRFDELYELCDRVTVLRDGRSVAERSLQGLDRLELVGLMLGREWGEPAAGMSHVPPADAPPLLEARGLRRGHGLHGVSLAVRPGEVVGLAGLLGSGRTETARILFGLDAPDAGELLLEGKSFRPCSPRDAIDAGVAFLPEDRKAEGIFPELSVRENLTMAALPRLSRCGVVSRAAQRDVVERFLNRLRIKALAGQPLRELSGGNQQKVLLARWLCREPRLLILDEPTRGVDVGAKHEIRGLIAELAAGGLAVLLISSELDELVEACDRVVVLRDGRSVAEMRGDAVSEGSIMRAMAGGGP
jgi:monosaccharide-transporting ATPase